MLALQTFHSKDIRATGAARSSVAIAGQSGRMPVRSILVLLRFEVQVFILCRSDCTDCNELSLIVSCFRP